MTRPTPRSFLCRLAKDARGNTLAIVGAALVPLTGMIGSGVDISRAYMAKTRLQAACDAAVLAGRRVMVGEVVDAEVRNEAGRFFAFNFPTGVYGSNPITVAAGAPTGDEPDVDDRFYVWLAAQGTVAGRASTALPTGVMHLFGFETMDIRVDCAASHDFNNIDIMLVLDVTGSMGCVAEDTPAECSAYANANTYRQDEQNYVVEKAGSRLLALEGAVAALYDQLAPVQQQLDDNDLQLRYGVVPYSSGVNVGALLMAANPASVVGSATGETWNYRSRSNTTTTTSNIGETRCRRIEDAVWANSRCTYYAPTQRTVDVSGYVRSLTASNPAFDAATLVGGAAKPTRWRGCIEERQTSSTITDVRSNTDGALDMDIDDGVSSSIGSRWKPYFPRIIYSQTGVSSSTHAIQPQVACPAPAAQLAVWPTRDDLTDYLATLLPTGGTYHDNGMRWAARLISDRGIFSHSPLENNNRRVDKHIIFMTDGVLDTGPVLYSAYGVEQWDQRVTGSNNMGDQDDRHNARFAIMCQRARQLGTDRDGRGVTIWVVAFASELTPELSACATSPEHAFVATDNDDLRSKFQIIGKEIGALRLSK